MCQSGRQMLDCKLDRHKSGCHDDELNRQVTARVDELGQESAVEPQRLRIGTAVSKPWRNSAAPQVSAFEASASWRPRVIPHRGPAVRHDDCSFGATMAAALRPYFKKRDFTITSEPKGGASSKAGRLSFVVQKHAASHLHYDFRLELDGTLKSWAVPKGPSLDPADKRMAVHVEDHPIDYGRFEGEIPGGQYGAGSVIVWDNGTWVPVGDARAGYCAGKLKFQLHGKKLTGGWTLVRMHDRATERQEPWLLIKERDEAARPASQYSIVEAEPGSVLSNRTIANPPPRAAKQAASAARAKAPAGRKRASSKASAKAALPDALVPQLATLVTQAPADGHIRHAVFHGLRDDKPARSIVREQPAPAAAVEAAAKAEAAPALKNNAKVNATSKTASAKKAKAAKTATSMKTAKAAGETTIEGIRISHPERIIDASTGITKLDVINYYLDAARLILPHLAGRPVSLVRAPAGLGGQIVFQRHAGALHISELKELDQAIAPDLPPMIEVDSFAALVGAAQANVIEFHTWNVSKNNPTKPDRMIFDLDPGEGVGWKQIQEGAELTRAFLAEIGLASFLKTSGGKGLHVVVPIAPKDGWDTVKALSKRIVEHLAEVLPDRIVAKSGPKNRVGRIFVDYLRNGFGATTACAWSARARPGMGVSVPCTWDELGSISGGVHWTIANVHERIEERDDPWRTYAKTRQTLVKAMAALGVGRAAA